MLRSTSLRTHNAMHGNPVVEWFSSHFHTLHPRLQALHLHGGQLQGTVRIDFGHGIAGWLGRRIARRLGIPARAGPCGFNVGIEHRDDALLWSREFEGGARMVSVFRPVGHWPDGYWIERSGPLRLQLGVDIVDGGWYWRLRGAWLGPLRLPLALLPASRAHKRIVDDRYCFLVEFSIPLLGTVLRYAGELDLVGLAAAADPAIASA